MSITLINNPRRNLPLLIKPSCPRRKQKSAFYYIYIYKSPIFFWGGQYPILFGSWWNWSSDQPFFHAISLRDSILIHPFPMLILSSIKHSYHVSCILSGLSYQISYQACANIRSYGSHGSISHDSHRIQSTISSSIIRSSPLLRGCGFQYFQSQTLLTLKGGWLIWCWH